MALAEYSVYSFVQSVPCSPGTVVVWWVQLSLLSGVYYSTRREWAGGGLLRVIFGEYFSLLREVNRTQMPKGVATFWDESVGGLPAWWICFVQK